MAIRLSKEENRDEDKLRKAVAARFSLKKEEVQVQGMYFLHNGRSIARRTLTGSVILDFSHHWARKALEDPIVEIPVNQLMDDRENPTIL